MATLSVKVRLASDIVTQVDGCRVFVATVCGTNCTLQFQTTPDADSASLYNSRSSAQTLELLRFETDRVLCRVLPAKWGPLECIDGHKPLQTTLDRFASGAERSPCGAHGLPPETPTPKVPTKEYRRPTWTSTTVSRQSS